MVKTAAAQTIGTDAFALLAVIVTTEDARRYAGPVAFFNEQLMMLLGFGSRKRLVAARARAIEAGWLDYSVGGKSVAGLYFGCIPSELEQIPDGPSDESREICRSNTERKAERQMDQETICRSDSELNGGAMRNGKGTSYKPNPNPNPKETRSRPSLFDASQVELPSELVTDAFIAAWLEWCEHRREVGKRLKPTSTKQLLRDFTQWGPDRAVAAIRHTIAKGWQGIREPETTGKTDNGKPKPEHRPFATATQ